MKNVQQSKGKKKKNDEKNLPVIHVVYNANFSSPENDANNNHHGSIHVILRYHESVASISVRHVNGYVIVSQKLQCQWEEMPETHLR